MTIALSHAFYGTRHARLMPEVRLFMTSTMRANTFEGKDRIALREKAIPRPSYNEALIRVTLTTICGTDLHILRGEYPVRSGLTIGHEPVGVIAELGAGITGYAVGDRVLVGAITPCGQ